MNQKMYEAVYECNKMFAYIREFLKGERTEKEGIIQARKAELLCLEALFDFDRKKAHKRKKKKTKSK